MAVGERLVRWGWLPSHLKVDADSRMALRSPGSLSPVLDDKDAWAFWITPSGAGLVSSQGPERVIRRWTGPAKPWWRLLRVLCDAPPSAGSLDLRAVGANARAARDQWYEDPMHCRAEWRMLLDALHDAGLERDRDLVSAWIALGAPSMSAAVAMGMDPVAARAARNKRTGEIQALFRKERAEQRAAEGAAS